MQIHTLTVTYGRKINLGDYNNANLEITMGAEIEPDEDAIQCANRLWEMARDSVKQEAHRLVNKKGGND